MFVVFYTNFCIFCIFMTSFTYWCLCDTYESMECMYVSV